jgi:hypothetical protein
MGTVVMTDSRVVELREEERGIVFWRVDQFRRLGQLEEAAWNLALSEADLGTARRLNRAGCPPDVALQILL